MSEEIGEEDATMMTIDDPPAPPATATTPTDFLDHEPSKQEKIEVRRFQDSVLFLVQIPRSDSIVCRNIYGTVVETPLGNSVVEGICIAVLCFFAMERGGLCLLCRFSRVLPLRVSVLQTRSPPCGRIESKILSFVLLYCRFLKDASTLVTRNFSWFRSPLLPY